jgi:hypothetical protein
MYISLIQSVISPRKLLNNQEGINFILHFGWIFIIIRWLYYSIIFIFRNYHGSWAPFTSIPFNIDVDIYAQIQRIFALPYGIIIFTIFAATLYLYLIILKRKIDYISIVNILGVTFFIPFVIVQPIDQIVIHTIGWKIIPVTIIHSIILLWESWATIEVINLISRINYYEKIVGILILTITWIILVGPFWR